MKKYFNVTYSCGDSFYSSNIAHAESAEDVRRRYADEHPGADILISDCPECELDSARRKGKPIVEVDHVEDPEPSDASTSSVDGHVTTREISITYLGETQTRKLWDSVTHEAALEMLDRLHRDDCLGCEAFELWEDGEITASYYGYDE